MLYFVFVVLLTRIYGHTISRMSFIRALLALGAVALLAGGGPASANWRGVAMMLGSALMYALHVVLSQRVMYEMPAPTMTVYALTAMALTVSVAWFIHGRGLGVVVEPVSPRSWTFLLGLTAVTVLSRLTLFAGVKQLGGVQVVLLNVAELLVGLLSAFLFFGDRLSLVQWLGAILLLSSMVLSQWDERLSAKVYRPLLTPRAPSQSPTFTGFVPTALRQQEPRSQK
jgi:drug/metabolite transporter (DMT)-like permease